MNFLSIEFVIFVFVVAVINYILPQRIRTIGLLAGSLVFYYIGSKQFIGLLAVICFVTYLFGWLIEKYKKKYFYLFGVLSVLVALVYFKYFTFMLDVLQRFFTIETNNVKFEDMIVPLGISFMTFQAISYLGDIYYGKMRAERDFTIVALQVCFFPNVTSGPIQKARNFIPQLKDRAKFDYELVKHGLLLYSFGGLQKYYISDKLAPIIDNMLSDVMSQESNAGFHYLIFAFTYAIYIYSNFNSYSDMAIGIAQILGMKFSENFRRPYLSQSIKEFWQRWHISLNSWFVEYVYIPLGGSRKGKIRYFINIIVVFFASGLWHGASLHYIAWGLLNAGYQIVGNITSGFRNKVYEKLKVNPMSPIVVVWKRFCVFYLISVSWIFFAVPGTQASIKFVVSMLFPSALTLFDGWFFGQFDSVSAMVSLLGTVLIFSFIQVQREKTSISKKIEKEPIIVRYTIYTVIVVMLLFGFFGTFTGAGNGGFIYGDF